MSKKETIAEALREEQGDATFTVFSELLGFSLSNTHAWVSGQRYPSEDTINKMSEALDWSDEKRMSFMPEPEEKGLMKKVMRHRQRLKLKQSEFANYIGVAYQTLKKWRSDDKNIPNNRRKDLERFLKASREDVLEIIRYENIKKSEAERKKRRTEIPYDVIQKLECRERGFGRMSDVPDDHPELLKLQRYMNSEW